MQNEIDVKQESLQSSPAWQRPTLTRLSLDETLFNNGSTTDGNNGNLVPL